MEDTSTPTKRNIAEHIAQRVRNAFRSGDLRTLRSRVARGTGQRSGQYTPVVRLVQLDTEDDDHGKQ